jgi:hypothetical protein
LSVVGGELVESLAHRQPATALPRASGAHQRTSCKRVAVIPAKAGIQIDLLSDWDQRKKMDSRLRGNDDFSYAPPLRLIAADSTWQSPTDFLH